MFENACTFLGVTTSQNKSILVDSHSCYVCFIDSDLSIHIEVLKQKTTELESVIKLKK